jgi:hypothetical protein
MGTFKNQNDLDVTASSQTSVDELDKFGTALLGFSNKVDCIVALADKDLECPLAQAYAAQFFASAETKQGVKKAKQYLERANNLSKYATPREQAIIKSSNHWCQTERRAAAQVLEQVLDENPSDIVSSKWAQSLHFDTGNAAGILRAPLKVAEACDDNAYLHGMLAFGYEECHLLNEAEASVNRALSIQRDEPWAHHAMAHISEARHNLDGGIKFMLDVSDTWQNLSSFMTTHNWWHVCLFLVDLNRGDEALAYFDKIVWAVNQDCVQDQINAISLLYRLERIGVDVGNRWQNLAEKVILNCQDQVSVFLDFQFLYALARANHKEADNMMQRMIARHETVSQDEKMAWELVALPAAPGIIALANGDWQKAIDQLSIARPFLQCIGGSHAQRELVALFYIDALRGASQWEKVQQILSLRYRARPQVSWIKNQLRDAYDHLGLSQVVDF